ncbi:MAG TPA: hypothetical protein VE258_11015, partial [Ktedonobacterales bacterium]|nr:hypothetical protein [Ktedonobacterales bacterium]
MRRREECENVRDGTARGEGAERRTRQQEHDRQQQDNLPDGRHAACSPRERRRLALGTYRGIWPVPAPHRRGASAA